MLSTEHILLKVIEKVLPWPSLLCTFTLPPIDSMMDLQMDRPRPRPLGLLLWCSARFPKLMKRLSI